jgi:hypothetical protein
MKDEYSFVGGIRNCIPNQKGEVLFPPLMVRQTHHKWEGIKGRVKRLVIPLRQAGTQDHPCSSRPWEALSHTNKFGLLYLHFLLFHIYVLPKNERLVSEVY